MDDLGNPLTDPESVGDPNFLQLYRITGESKIDGCISFLDILIDSGSKFLLFAHHISVMDAYEQYLLSKQKTNHKGFFYIRIDGSTASAKRHELVNQFQTCPSLKVALLSIGACSHGITLTAASTIVFAELAWTPSILQQAEDRAHRISQKNSVNIYYLHGAGTLDDTILRMLKSKNSLICQSLDGFDHANNGFNISSLGAQSDTI